MVHTLNYKVDLEDTRLSREREELESKLREKREKFTANIDDLVLKIDLLKTTFTSTYQIKEANDMIKGYALRLSDYLKDMIFINQKEDLLGWSQTEFPKLLEA